MSARPFMHEDFLLTSELARRLYHGYAASQPIIDYHCHLPPEAIARDHRFADLAEVWLGGDHYKWRALRAAGVDERFITGDASPREKFQKWAETVPRTLRNPLYHWTHLELKKPFGLSDRLLGPDSAEGVWQHCNELLATPAFSACGLMQQWDVRVACTTDDPVDTLEHHLAIARRGAATRVLPTWRPDKVHAVDDPASWNAYIDRLAAAADVDIRDWDSLFVALKQRHAFFHAVGCRLSDHGLEAIHAADWTHERAARAVAELRAGNHLAPDQAELLKSALLHELALLDHASGWVQQFHLGALRNNNRRLLAHLGPDTGFDSIGDFAQGRAMSTFFDRLDAEDRLARTIVYNLNPRDNELFATMIGNFQDGSTPGKMQYGSGWWFLDQWDGMNRQLEALSNQGLLSCFVGMLTDSRSFLSYARHEYFRRLLCELLANDVARGALPNDEGLLGGLVADLSHGNAQRYFAFETVQTDPKLLAG